MQNYRFVGNQMEIGSRKLTKFGEVIALTPEQRKEQAPPAPLVHEALFTRVGFTEQELDIYARPSQRVGAPDAFTRKVQSAWALVGQEPAPVADKAEVTK